MPTVFIESCVSKLTDKKTFKVRVRALKKEGLNGQKSRTFSSKQQAIIFKKKLESLFSKGDLSFLLGSKKAPSLGQVIDDYLTHPRTKNLSNVKAISTLKRIANNAQISHLATNKIDAHIWYNLSELMINDWGVKPQTAANYLSILKSALNNAKVILQYPIDLSSYSEGIKTSKNVGYIGNSKARTRRPSQDEISQINNALAANKLAYRCSFPMYDIFHFACETGLRLGEICGKITWADYDQNKRILTVKNRKNRHKGTENTSIFQVSDKVHSIIIKQPQTQKSDPIFAYNSRSVSAAWRRIMKELAIENLHFHDLRAEALCRLYERGLSLVEISKISGHKDINILNNFYLRLYPTAALANLDNSLI